MQVGKSIVMVVCDGPVVVTVVHPDQIMFNQNYFLKSVISAYFKKTMVDDITTPEKKMLLRSVLTVISDKLASVAS